MKIIEYDLAESPSDLSAQLLMEYLKLRVSVFIDGFGWSLDENQRKEFDLYDVPDTKYIFMANGKEFVAGVRLIRTDRTVGVGGANITYMINDAYQGRLNTISASICSNPPPTHAGAWEISRLISKGGRKQTTRLFLAANKFVQKRGGTSCLFLGSPGYQRWGRALGFKVNILGPLVKDEGGATYCALETEIK